MGLCVNMFTWRCAEAPTEPGAELPSRHSQLARVGRGRGAAEPRQYPGRPCRE